MNKHENVVAIQELWAALAAYFQVQLSDEQIRMYAEDCGHYSADAIGRGMKRWRMNPKHGRLPLPGQLLESMGGGSSRSNASGIAFAIVGAIKKYDYTWPIATQAKFYKTGSFEGDFKQELGDVAWEVVKLAGGWSSLCGSFWDCGNETAFMAQIRDATEHVIVTKRGQVHTLDDKPSLPAPAGDQADARLAELTKQIGQPKEDA
jgi:hypothetical protein